MAIVKNNILIQGLSGTIGHIIMFRQVAGRTIVTSARGANVNPPTPNQLARRQLFRDATLYAKACRQHPDLLAAYAAAGAARHLSATNMAISDFMEGPKVTEIDVQDYGGKPGDYIKVRATDNFCVTAVRVTILTTEGTEVENGEAMQQPDLTEWIYTTIGVISNLVGTTIRVHAYDLPGNIASREILL